MEEFDYGPLLADLKHPEEDVRHQATEKLWWHWFNQKGAKGLAIINHSQRLIEQEELEQAEQLLTRLINAEPDFAEAWNRRAILFYMQERYQDAVQDCEAVVRLNPYHFGAWHGLGLSHLALAQYREAILAFRRALEIQPYGLLNQRLLLECTAKLS